MSHTDLGSTDRRAAALANFAERPASQSWDAISCGDAPQLIFWVWYKPAHLPTGLVVQFPPETLKGYPHREQLTMRRVLRWLDLEPGCVWQWIQNGIPYDAQQGASPYLDQPLADPAPGSDPGIAITLFAPASPAATPPMPTAPPPADVGEIFENIDSEWKAIIKSERDLGLCRKKLSDMIARLNTLNRDLNHEEQLFADTADKAAWQDARRWLREAAARVSRYLKDCDVGDATSAVKREWMHHIYEQYITPKQMFDGIQHAHR